LIAVIDLAGTVLPPALLAPARRRLKRHLRAFGELRDVQVQHVLVGGLTNEFPVLRAYRVRLLARERTLIAAGHAEARRIAMAELGRQVETATGRLSSIFEDPVMQTVGHTAVAGAMAAAFARAIRARHDLRTDAPDTVHRLRVAFKKCRYSVEILAPLLPGMRAGSLKAMNTFQTRMGEIQDNEVLRAGVRAFARRQAGPAGMSFVGVLQHLAQRKRTLIASFVAQAGALNDFWVDPLPPAPRETMKENV
jgi:CHAD domain-containing protein